MTRIFHKIIYIIIRILTEHLTQASLFAKDDLMLTNFMKSFAHLLNYEFYYL